MANTNKLFVANVSWNLTEQDVIDIFTNVGTVSSVKMPLNPRSGRSKGYAFIEMASPEDAQNAIDQLHGAMVDNRELAVMEQDESRTEGGAQANPKLFIRNVGGTVTEDELYHVFKEAGEVISVKVPIDQMSGLARGFAFVEMGSTEQAQVAVDTINGKAIHDQALEVKFQDPNRVQKRPQQSDGYGGGGYGGGGGQQEAYGGQGYGSGYSQGGGGYY